jgi:hypothetical protein
MSRLRDNYAALEFPTDAATRPVSLGWLRSDESIAGQFCMLQRIVGIYGTATTWEITATDVACSGNVVCHPFELVGSVLVLGALNLECIVHLGD